MFSVHHGTCHVHHRLGGRAPAVVRRSLSGARTSRAVTTAPTKCVDQAPQLPIDQTVRKSAQGGACATFGGSGPARSAERRPGAVRSAHAQTMRTKAQPV